MLRTQWAERRQRAWQVGADGLCDLSDEFLFRGLWPQSPQTPALMRPFLGRPDLLTSPSAPRVPSAPGAEGLRGVRGGVWRGGRHLPPLRGLLQHPEAPVSQAVRGGLRGSQRGRGSGEQGS